MKPASIRKRRSAFTLVEIMVAATITIIMIGLVVQITSEVLKIWNRSVGKLSANAESRIAMELLTTDLETAVFFNNGQQWLRSENQPASGPGRKNTVALRLFAPALDRDTSQPGNICAIAYQLVESSPIDGSVGGPGDQLWILYRLVVSPEPTFNDLMGEPDQNALPSKDELSWSAGGTTESIIGENGANYLAQNIVEFVVEFYVEDDGDSSTPTGPIPADTIFGGPVGDNDATVGVNADNAAEEYFKKPLAYAEITLTSVSDEGATLLQLAEDEDEEEAIIREHGEVFKRRVFFQAKPF